MSDTFQKTAPKCLPFTPTQQELFDTWRTDAAKLAKCYYRRYESNRIHYDAEDMISMAYLALTKAVRKFEPERGVGFFTYFTGIYRRDLAREHTKRNLESRKPDAPVWSLDAEKWPKADVAHGSTSFSALIPDRKTPPPHYLVDILDEFEHLTGLGEKVASDNWGIVVKHICHEVRQTDMLEAAGMKPTGMSAMIRRTLGRVREKSEVKYSKGTI